MKRSIRTRIMLIFIGLVAVMLLAILAVNNCFLENYYTNQKLKVMERAYDDMNAAIMERVNNGESIEDVLSRELTREWDLWSELAPPQKTIKKGDRPAAANEDAFAEDSVDEDVQEELQGFLISTIRDYSEKNNIKIILIDSSTGKVMLDFGRESDFLAQKLVRYILGQGDNSETVLAEYDNYQIIRTNDPRYNASYLEAWGYFSDMNTQFMMQMPLASIRESVGLANKFTSSVGIVILVLGCVIMYFVTRRMTEPIMKLATLSERMSELDFDVHYEGNELDEVGVLGHSMNVLSEKLKETIGELKEANIRLQHDIQEKIEIDDMRKEFIANVSHELKTPIALIQGYAEGLTEGMAEDEDSRNYYCEVIMDEANKMNKMVKQLLTLTALEFGNDTPVFETFDIAELIRSLINSASILTQQKEVEVEVVCEEPVYVYADEFKIEEVVINYFNNALNHVNDGRRIRFTVEKIGDLARVTVYNTGESIPEESIPNLWTKFYKVDKARTREYGGSGIGLSIVRAIMDAHHQSCGVQNVDGGVEFWFTLALVDEETVKEMADKDSRTE